MYASLKRIGVQLSSASPKDHHAQVIKGLKIYETGKMRYNGMLSSIIRKMGGSYLKNIKMNMMVLGGNGTSSSLVSQVANHNKNNPDRIIPVYLEDDFLILLGEKRYYLENEKEGSFAFCHQDIYKPLGSLLIKGKIGELGHQTALGGTKIEDLLTDLKSKGYTEKELPKKWDLMRKFFVVNAGSRQNAAKGVKNIKINNWKEFAYFEDQGLSVAHLISHNCLEPYADSIEKIVFEESGYYGREGFNQGPKFLENYKNLRELAFHNIPLVELKFDMSKMKKLRILTLSNPKYSNYQYHNLKTIPPTIFESTSLLKLYLPETKEFLYSEEDKAKLKKLFIRNSLFALGDKEKKIRELATSVLIENISDPLEGELPKDMIFTSSGKLKGHKEKEIEQRLKEQGYSYTYAKDAAKIESSNVVIFLGANPQQELLEKTIELGWKPAIAGMLNDFVRRWKEAQKAPKEVREESDIKKSLKELLNHRDLQNVELGLEIASAQEILKEAHDEIFSISLVHPVEAVAKKAKKILSRHKKIKEIYKANPLVDIKAWELIHAHKSLHNDVVFPNILNYLSESNEEAKQSLAIDIIKKYGIFEDLITELVILAAFGETASIRNRCKTQIKNYADYEINDFIKNQWHGRLKGKAEGFQPFKNIVKHPQINPKRLTYLLSKHQKNASKYSWYYSDAMIKFAIEQKTVEALPEAELKNVKSLSIGKDYINQELQKFPELYSLNIYQHNGEKLKELPSGIISSSKLTHFSANYNNLEDLPSDFYLNHNLSRLELRGNKFKTVPAVVFKLGNLQILDICDNEISELPPEIKQLTGLKKLYTHGMNKSGTPISVFEHISSLQSLEAFSASGVADEEALKKLAQLPNLRELRLNNCELSQEVLESFQSLKNLHYLSIPSKYQKTARELLPHSVRIYN